MHNFRAQAAPAISHSYSRGLTLPANRIRQGKLPQGLTLSDFNFSDSSNCLVTHNTHLISAGQYLHKTPDLHPIPTTNSLVTALSDWGGFSIIDNPSWYQGKTTVVQSVKWQEKHSDVAISPDIPSRSATKPNATFDTMAKCLDASEQNKK